jgi:hypothetical protein
MPSRFVSENAQTGPREQVPYGRPGCYDAVRHLTAYVAELLFLISNIAKVCAPVGMTEEKPRGDVVAHTDESMGCEIFAHRQSGKTASAVTWIRYLRESRPCPYITSLRVIEECIRYDEQIITSKAP